MKPLLVVALLFSSLSLAAQKVAILPFTGPKAAAAQKQLSEQICSQASCVAKKAKPAFTVEGKTKGNKLQLLVKTQAKKVKLSKSYEVNVAGRLPESTLDEARNDVLAAVLGGHLPKKQQPQEEPPPPPPEHKNPQRDEAPPPPPPPATEPQTQTQTQTQSTPPPATQPPAEAEAEAPRHYRGRAPTVIAELGVDLGMRFFTYSDVQTANLRRYTAYFIFMPRFHLELYPVSRLIHGPASGIGVEAEYSFAAGLQSSAATGPSYPTKLSRLDVAARFRMQPLSGSDLVINPIVGYRAQSFASLPASDGSVLTGLANIDYTALRVGATVEQPLMDGKASVLGELTVLPVLGTGALKTYFPNASGFGFELAVGGGFTVVQKLELRILGRVTRYGLGFKADPADTYRAGGASDLYPSVGAALHYSL